MFKIKSGKVRDIYQFETPSSEGEICIVASDRVSAFDHVIPGLEIKDKGRILTEISKRWAELIDFGSHIGPVDCETAYQQMSAKQLEEVAREGIDPATAQSQLELQMIPVEAIVRGYITGSLWKAYNDEGLREFCGIALPDGLKEGDELPEPIFTPTTKATVGKKDENLSFEGMIGVIDRSMTAFAKSKHNPRDLAEKIRAQAIAIFQDASVEAWARDIIIADTKLEFGLDSYGRLLVGDEILTPDSSRFWAVADYEPGRPQKSLDKQIIRDFIKSQKEAGVTEIIVPPEVIKRTRLAYQKILDTLFPDDDE